MPTRDGTRLAARIWLPESASDSPVPAILEYIPYRKRDGTRQRDERMHRWFAGHGYAAVRVDVRGSGDSEGVLEDEYTPTEQADAWDVLAWIRAQTWCDGAVGMMGKSWGGFSALQVAALRPPGLKAVIAVCATDDRYADDAHYMGGCVLGENLVWGTSLMTLCAQPPDPALAGAGWRQQWLERLAAIAPFPATWLRHPRRDGYWRHGSVCEDFGAIECPVYAISGWADGYTNAVPRLLAGLRAPCKGLIGPWAHVYPHEGVPGPAVGFLQTALRWWDRWLRGQENGVMNEPRLRVWMQASERPRSTAAVRGGRWVAEERWPSPRIVACQLSLSPDGRLVERAPPSGATVAVRSVQTVGRTAGAWCGFGLDGELPGDQRPDDERSVRFDSTPLTEPLELFGAPELELDVVCDGPAAILCARLCEVFPDGTSARLSYGLLDLAHRHGHARPEPVQVGQRERVVLRMNDLAQSVRAGNRLRLALSTSYWPLAWPSPSPVTVRVEAARSKLRLPVRPERPEDADLAPFPPPESAPTSPFTDVHKGGVTRSMSTDARDGALVSETVLDLEADGTPSMTRFDAIDLETGHGIREVFSIRPDDPLSAKAHVEHRTSMRRSSWSVAVELDATLSADAAEFRFVAELRAKENGATVWERRWDECVPRDLTR